MTYNKIIEDIEEWQENTFAVDKYRTIDMFGKSEKRTAHCLKGFSNEALAKFNQYLKFSAGYRNGTNGIDPSIDHESKQKLQ